jgi:D-ribose pyranase
VKKSGVINAKLAGALAELGHTDRVVVCAAGLPLPPGPEVVDLAFRFGVPSSEVVLSGLLEELIVEGATAAEEVERNPRTHELLTANLPDLGLVPHEELKRMVAAKKLVSAPARPRPTRTSSSAAGYLSRALR